MSNNIIAASETFDIERDVAFNLFVLKVNKIILSEHTQITVQKRKYKMLEDLCYSYFRVKNSELRIYIFD